MSVVKKCLIIGLVIHVVGVSIKHKYNKLIQTFENIRHNIIELDYCCVLVYRAL